MSHRWRKKGNVLVVLYEWRVKPEVERNVLVSFRQALNRKHRPWIIGLTWSWSATGVCDNTYSAGFKHDLYVAFNHRPVLQADDCSVVAHVRKHLKRPELGQHACRFEAAVAWRACMWRGLPSSFPVSRKHTGTPAASSEWFSPWGRCHRLYPPLSKKKKKHERNIHKKSTFFSTITSNKFLLISCTAELNWQFKFTIWKPIIILACCFFMLKRKAAYCDIIRGTAMSYQILKVHNTALVWAGDFRRNPWLLFSCPWEYMAVLPPMEWMRMLLILSLLGRGSCLLNLVFIVS